MKKLSIILLALAFALVMTVPALAIHIGTDGTEEGGLGITGTYKIDGQANDDDGTKSAAYDDDFEVVLKFSTGKVTAVIDLEISDDGTYDGKDVVRGSNPITNVSGAIVTLDETISGVDYNADGDTADTFTDVWSGDDTDTHTKLVDNYWVTYEAMDNLTLKFGEYSCGFGRLVGTDGACGHNLQATYSLDAADISLILSKEVEAGEDDRDAMVLMAMVKEAGPFTKLNAAYYNITDDRATGVAGDEKTYTGLDVAIPLGPVGFAMEYGANGGDNEGNFMLFEIGLEDLIGFNLNVHYFMSSDDYLSPYSGDDYSPLGVFFDEVNAGQTDATAIWLTAGYNVDDNLSVGAKALAKAENDAGDDLGTEFDVSLKYKLADNVTYDASYASYSAGDFTVDRTELFHRLTLKF